MVQEIAQRLEEYRQWLRDKTALRQLHEGWVEITTPYLDRHNDALQVYVRADQGGYLLTDDGYTVNDLEVSGCNLQTEKRWGLLTLTLNGFGVKLNGSALEVRAPPESFPLKKHSLIQAILAINDLFYLAQPLAANLFLEDVAAWLEENDIRCVPDLKLAGVSGYDHRFSFVVPKSRRQPLRIIQAINRPTRESALQLINAWSDTRPNRETDSKAYALLNDSAEAVSPNVTDALRNYQIHRLLWSARSNAVAELAA